MFPTIDRIYINEHPRNEPGWNPRYTFSKLFECLKANEDP